MMDGFLTTEAEVPNPHLPGRLIYQVLAGSHAYGLAGPDSDADWRGVYLLPSEKYLGLHLPGVSRMSTPEAVSLEPDQTYHELRHYCTMLLRGNPNPIEWLWLDERFVAKSSPVMEKLRAMREHFFSAQMLRAYQGWAKAERLSLHEKWDNKAASHLLRILMDFRVALTERRLQVTFEGAQRQMLMAAKYGHTDAPQLLSTALRLEEECQELAAKAGWPVADEAPVEALLIEARRGELG